MPKRLTKLSAAATLFAGALMTAGLSGCNKTQSTATLVADAKQYQTKGDLRAAVIQLKNAAANSPEDAEVRLLLADIYNASGDPVSAEKEVRKAISLGLPPDRTMPILAAALRAQGQAAKLLKETEASSSMPTLLAMRGDAYRMTGEADKATDSYQRALAATPGDPEALIGLARLAMTRQDADTALRLTEEAVTKNPKNTDALMFKASVLRAQQKPELARVVYDQVHALQPNHLLAHVEKANLGIEKGQFDAAQASLEPALKLAPDNLNVLYAQASLENALEKNAAALATIQKVLKVAPEHLPSILLAAISELKLGSHQQAQQHLRKLLEAQPQHVHARKLLAMALLRDNNPTEAASVLEPALKAQPEDPSLLAIAAETQAQSRDFKKAAAYLAKASELAPQSATLRAALATSKLRQGDASNAVSDLEAAILLDPKLEQASVLLIQTELNLKHFDKAMAAVLALEKQQPDNPAVHNLKGGVLLGKNDSAAARASFEKALALQPTYFAASANLAQLDLNENKPEAAKKRFETVLAKDAKNIDAMNSLARMAALQGNQAEATTWLERASTQNPDSVGPALTLGEQYLRAGQTDKALTLIRKFQTANSANPALLDLLGQAQVASKDPAAALETYSKLVNVTPANAGAHVRLANVQMMMKNPDGAAQSLKKALSLQPDFLPAQIAQAELAARSGRPEQSLDIARQIQKQRPGSPIGHSLEGDLMLAQSKAAPAAQAYQRALALDGANSTLMVKLHQSLQRSGKANDADALLAKWVAGHPDDVRVLMYSGEAKMAKGQYKLAIAAFEPALAKVPNNPVILNNLALAYQQEKDARATATAELAFKHAPDSPEVMDTLGWMLVEQGDTARGLPLLQKAASLSPKADVRYHLAVALNKSGDKAGARKELEKLLSGNTDFAKVGEARALLKTL